MLMGHTARSRRATLYVLLGVVGYSCFNFAIDTSQLPTEVALLERPPTLLYRFWSPLIQETRAYSLRCPNLILLTVLVHSSRNEPHHALNGKPNISPRHCAVLLLLHTYEETRTDYQAAILGYKKLGWYVIHTSARVPALLGRRLSRYPKLTPGKFFPHTATVVYSDTKYVKDINSIDASVLAKKLLNGTQFGIVQHYGSGDVTTEYDMIHRSVAGRPAVIDSLDSLDMQMLRLNHTLSSHEQSLYGVEGRLHAHQLIGSDGSSTMFDEIWLEEFLSGCDRDQIAFYGAAARMKLRLSMKSPCKRFNRCGVYVSDFDTKFTLTMHSTLEDLTAS